MLECIGWEVIVIDECQRSRISSHSTQIKILSTKMRLLVLGCQLKVFISCTLILVFLLLLEFCLNNATGYGRKVLQLTTLLFSLCLILIMFRIKASRCSPVPVTTLVY